MKTRKAGPLRRIPSVDKLLGSEPLAGMTGIPHGVLVDAVRTALDQTRKDLLSGSSADLTDDELHRVIVSRVTELAAAALRPHYRKALNATGIILHTGLGRAVLPKKVLQQIQEELDGYSVLQLDTVTGKRGKRDERIEGLLTHLTGAEAATVVNNNAAATMLVLNTVARGREVIVSRGQLVEIGGSFRLPEVMAASGAHMVEVGTTNKTHPRDYENAVTENTAAILRIHPSNYKLVGFTSEVALDEVIDIAHRHNLVLIDDVGAGALIDFSRFGFRKDPTLPESIAAGADIVTSSADKLIGGSQGGVILGRRELIDAVRKNPIARMVRLDKLCLAALEATLTLFLDEETAMSEVPTLKMLNRSLDEVTAQARRIASALAGTGAGLSVVEGFSQMGSGSLPEQNLETMLVRIECEDITPDTLARRLRGGRPSVFTRVQDDAVLIDPRTLQEGEEEVLIDALDRAISDES